MYRLMKCEMLSCDDMNSDFTSPYQQTEVEHFTHFKAALKACEMANINGRSRFYVLNELGKEYYDCAWID